MWETGEVLLLLAAAFAAGALNAVAGGGSFLTLPALVAVGLPPIAANATGTVALLPGYISAAYAFRDRMQAPVGLSLAGVAQLSLLGGAAGAGLLLWTPSTTFDAVVPWLLLLATLVFACGPRILRATQTAGLHLGATASVTGVLVVSVYGGYFNGGLGIMLLALFAVLGLSDIHGANGVKNLVSAVLTAVAVVVYAWGGVVSWQKALLMMLAATAGGYLGGHVIRGVDPARVRQVVVLIGFAMTVVFFWRV